jgi:hypothetical protein
MNQLRQTNNNYISQLATSVAIFFSRFDILPANISPLGTFGFFGNPVMYGVSIIAFDLLVKGIYPGFWLTYLGFACYPLLGWLTKRNTRHQLLAIPFASFLFFLISNLGVWWYWYDHTLAKLIICYSLAVPFYARTLIGDLFFGYGYLYTLRNENVFSEISTRIARSFSYSKAV